MKKILFLLIFISACSVPETIIKDRKIEITVPQIKDSLSGTFVGIPDSLVDIFQIIPDTARIEATKEIVTAKGDKVKVYLNYKPKTNTFTLDIPEFKVDTTIVDTTKITIKKEATTAEKFGYMFWGAIGILLITGGLFVLYKYRTFSCG